jgi:hypothetical protein
MSHTYSIVDFYFFKKKIIRVVQELYKYYKHISHNWFINSLFISI